VYAFDLLHLNGRDLKPSSMIEPLRRLERSLRVARASSLHSNRASAVNLPVHTRADKRSDPSKPTASVVRIEVAGDVGQAADDGERQHRIQNVEEEVWHVIPRSSAPLVGAICTSYRIYQHGPTHSVASASALRSISWEFPCAHVSEIAEKFETSSSLPWCHLPRAGAGHRTPQIRMPNEVGGGLLDRQASEWSTQRGFVCSAPVVTIVSEFFSDARRRAMFARVLAPTHASR
jgi:hypothetical protein